MLASLQALPLAALAAVVQVLADLFGVCEIGCDQAWLDVRPLSEHLALVAVPPFSPRWGGLALNRALVRNNELRPRKGR